jgi:hypothetical protein
MTETEEYPLPTVHLNGTSKEMLYKGNIHILQAIQELEESISKCEFHGRDYYVQDTDPHSYGTYNKALDERRKHLKNIIAFKEYIEKHLEHIDSQ